VALTEVTAPTAEPVTVAELRTHSRIDDITEEGPLLVRLIKAARRWCEAFLSQSMVNTTFDLTLDCFPAWEIRLPRCPLQSVTSITYIDANGDSQTVSSSDYIVDTKTKPGRITPAFGDSWPSTQSRINAVTVRFVAGYGAAASAVPDEWKQAILLLAGHWYGNREAGLVGTISKEIEFGVKNLLWMDRLVTV
jgi:uncharacterized phiE125 gp8 family phage protein